jgi:hypothetical protein
LERLLKREKDAAKCKHEHRADCANCTVVDGLLHGYQMAVSTCIFYLVILI